MFRTVVNLGTAGFEGLLHTFVNLPNSFSVSMTFTFYDLRKWFGNGGAQRSAAGGI